MRKGLIFSLSLTLIAILWLSTTPVAGQQAGNLGEREAQMYADAKGVSLEEAIRRIQLQGPAGELGEKLIVDKRDTLAGIWIQHEPEFKIIVQLTSGGFEAVQSYIQGGPLAELVEVRNAKTSLVELEATQVQAWDVVQKLNIPADSGINVFENRVEIYVIDVEQFTKALQSAGILLPDTVAIIETPQLAEPAVDIYAGLPINNCTSGFLSRTSAGVTGIITAAHCPDAQSYGGVNLSSPTVIRYFGPYDFQFHTISGLTGHPWYTDGSLIYTVNATKGRDPLLIGEWVCKYGKTTGFGCGGVIDKNFVTSGPSNPTATYIRVRGSVDLAEGGDSGGPVFVSNTALGNTAYGIVQAQSGNDLIYTNWN